MTRAALLVAILLGPISLAAQNSPAGPVTFGLGGSESRLTFQTEQASGCPINMRADQGVWNRDMLLVHKGDKERAHNSFGQKITVRLKDPQSVLIASATLRVRGLNGKNRMQEIPAGDRSRWNTVRTVQATFVEESDGEVSAELWLPGFTAVSSIELLAVSYSDGSAWKASGPNACRTQPNPLMLITSR